MLTHFLATLLLLLPLSTALLADDHAKTPTTRPAPTDRCTRYPIGRAWTKGYPENQHAEVTTSGNLIFIPSDDGTGSIWNITTGKALGKIPSIGLRGTPNFSPDGKWFLSTKTPTSIAVTNTETFKEAFTINHKDVLFTAQFSPNGKYITSTANDGTLIVTDLATGKELRRHTSPISILPRGFSPDGRIYAYTSLGDRESTYDEHTIHLLDLATGKPLFNFSKKITRFEFLHGKFTADGKYFVSSNVIGDFEVFEVPSGKTISKLTISDMVPVTEIALSPNGKQLITQSETNGVTLRDIPNLKPVATYKGNGWLRSPPQFDPTGRYFHPGWNYIVDLQTNKQIKLEAPRNLHFKPDGTGVLYQVGATADPLNLPATIREGEADLSDLSHPYYELKYTDLNTLATKNLGNQGDIHRLKYSPSGNSALLYMNSFLALKQLDEVCLTDDFNLISPEPTPFPPQLLGVCKVSYDEKGWKSLLPEPSKDLKAETLTRWLWRFQKPGGFTPKTDLNLLLAALRNADYVKQNGPLIAAVMENVLATSNLLYEALVKDFPVLKALPPSDPQCRTPDEAKLLVGQAENYLNYIIQSNPEKIDFTATENKLSPLNGLLSQMGPISRNAFIATLAEKIANQAADSPEFQGIFHSKLVRFAKASIYPWFGEAKPPLTDLTLIRQGPTVIPVILGSEPIDGDSTTQKQGAFHLKRLPSIRLENEMNISPIKWTQGKHSFEAKVSIKALDPRDIKSMEKSPPYKEMWKDGIFSGFLVAGTNIKHISPQLMRSYQYFYETRGYKFGSAIDVPDTHALLKDRIASGKADYFLKEAHSDGDERNLFRMDKKGKLIVGEKTLADGKKARIEILLPSENVTGSALISNQEFGDWMKQRDLAKQGPLVYFNTSCWSYIKAIREIEAAQSPSFINIPTKTLTYTFSHADKNTERLMLEAFLDQQPYSGIRQNMENSPKYQNRREDQFLFPDEEAYDHFIWKVLEHPIKEEIKIIDESGKEVILDEQH